MSLDNMGTEGTAVAEGEVDFRSGDGSMRVRYQTATEPGYLLYEVMVADRVTFLQPPGMEAASGNWVMSEGPALLAPLGLSASPESFIELLRHASDDFEIEGEEEVRGIATIHYRVEIAGDRLSQTILGSSAEEMAETDGPSSISGDPVMVDVWLDGEGLLRREAFEISLGNGPTPFSLEIFDYGVEVDVEAPPPEKVIEES